MGFRNPAPSPNRLLQCFGYQPAVVLKWAAFVIVFLTAYCAQPLLVDVIKMNGGAHSTTFLILLPHYGSMMLVGLFPKQVPLSECDWKTAMMLSGIDIVNQLMKKLGLVFAGAAVYIIIDSSSIVWTAVWSVILLKRRLSLLQWSAIGLIFVGVALKAFTLEINIQNEEFLGVVFISLAAMSMGLNFVLCEHFMLRQTKPIPGPNLVCMMGTCCSAVLALWTIGWTIPRFDALIVQRIHSVGGSPNTVILAFMLLIVTGVIHSSSFWYIIKRMGAVSSGVLKGLKVALVFVMSHYFFCETRPSQCLTPLSTASAVVCVSGVMMYSVVTAVLHKQHRAEARVEDQQRLLEKTGDPYTEERSLHGRMVSRGVQAGPDLQSLHFRKKALLRVEADESLVHNASMVFTHASITHGLPRTNTLSAIAFTKEISDYRRRSLCSAGSRRRSNSVGMPSNAMLVVDTSQLEGGDSVSDDGSVESTLLSKCAGGSTELMSRQ
eukprot:Lankesteria_metandrocarpae@DN4151_c1_g1_i2.p1